MSKYKFFTVLLVLSSLMTFSSIMIPKQGEGYYCGEINYIVLNRDERGIPFTYIKRSVTSTACSLLASEKNKNVTIESEHSIEYWAIPANIIFWSFILFVSHTILKKASKKQ